MNVKLTLPKGRTRQFDNFLKKGALWYVASESEHNICLHAAQSTGIIPASISSSGTLMSANNEHKEYRNPPIVEKVCQFLLTPDTPWDITIPGLIYDKVPKEFRKKQPGVIRRIQITPPPQGAPQTPAIEGVRFLTDDERRFIQVAPRFLAINCLKPCPTWKELEPIIKEICDTLTSVTQIENFQGINLIYVNRIEIPSPSATIKLDEYFEFRPCLGDYLPKNTMGFIVGCMLPFNNDRDICKVELQPAIPQRPDQKAFLLRLDYLPAKPKTISVTDALGWVDNAHENIVTTFEDCIKEPLREIFRR